MTDEDEEDSDEDEDEGEGRGRIYIPIMGECLLLVQAVHLPTVVYFCIPR